jgi:hypothetical protein
MRQMFDDARLDGSMHQQLMERMSNLLSHGDSPPLPPGATPAGEALSPNATATLVDGDRVITISGEKGHRRLTITDKGRRIFEGPVDTDADRARIPQAYQPDARRLFDLNVGP